MGKGQYLVVNEVFLFALGILISVYVLTSFNTVQKTLDDVATKDHFRNIADVAAAGAVKAAVENSSVAISFPGKISERVYVIELKDDSVLVYDFDEPDIKVSQKLFNLARTTCTIEGIYCLGGSVLSSAERAEIYVDQNGKDIRIRRG